MLYLKFVWLIKSRKKNKKIMFQKVLSETWIRIVICIGTEIYFSSFLSANQPPLDEPLPVFVRFSTSSPRSFQSPSSASFCLSLRLASTSSCISFRFFLSSASLLSMHRSFSFCRGIPFTLFISYHFIAANLLDFRVLSDSTTGTRILITSYRHWILWIRRCSLLYLHARMTTTNISEMYHIFLKFRKANLYARTYNNILLPIFLQSIF